MPAIKTKLRQRDKIAIVNVIVLILIVSIYFFIIAPNLDRLSQIDQSTSEQINALELKERKTATRLPSKINTTDAEKLLNNFSRKVISNDLLFVTGIEDMATKNKLTERLSMGEPQIIDGYRKIPISITSSGSYNNQLNFLYDLQNSDFYININSAEVTATTNDELNFLITADTYWKQ